MAMDTKRVPTKARHLSVRPEEIRCGWCKGWVHEVWTGMQRYVHDDPPATEHEVLPYRPTESGRLWTSTQR